MIFQGLCEFHNLLFAAFKGKPGDDQLYYGYWDGSGWSSRYKIEFSNGSAKSNVGVALTVFNNQLYAALKGASDTLLWFSSATFDSQTQSLVWQPQARIQTPASGAPEFRSSTGPSLAVYNNQLYALYQGATSDGLYYTSMTASTPWTSQYHIPLVGAFAGATLAALNIPPAGTTAAIPSSLLYAGFGGATKEYNWYMVIDPPDSSFPAPNITESHMAGYSSIGPSFAIFGEYLYAAWVGEGNDERIWFSSLIFQQVTPNPVWGPQWAEPLEPLWTPQQQIPSGSALTGPGDAGYSSVGPALAQFGSDLYGMWVGPSGDNTLYFGYLNSTGWKMSGSTGYECGQD